MSIEQENMIKIFGFPAEYMMKSWKIFSGKHDVNLRKHISKYIMKPKGTLPWKTWSIPKKSIPENDDISCNELFRE